MPNENHFDYIIIGHGLAGLQLALGFMNDDELKHKKIALIDPSNKAVNDKTWSFWETGSSKWDTITEKSWKTALFHSKNQSLSIHLKPYTYKSIRSIDFYNWAKKHITTINQYSFYKGCYCFNIRNRQCFSSGQKWFIHC